MRHRVAAKHFNRDVNQRQALIKSLVRNLVLHGEITTTKTKAQEAKRWADKLISKARQNDVSARRVLHHFFGKRDVVNTIVDTIAPLFTVNSGFTTSKSMGVRRGDNAEMMKVELIKKPAVMGTFKNQSAKAEKATATAGALSEQKVVAKKVTQPAKTAAPTKAKAVKKTTTKKAVKEKKASKK